MQVRLGPDHDSPPEGCLKADTTNKRTRLPYRLTRLSATLSNQPNLPYQSYLPHPPVQP